MRGSVVTRKRFSPIYQVFTVVFGVAILLTSAPQTSAKKPLERSRPSRGNVQHLQPAPQIRSASALAGVAQLQARAVITWRVRWGIATGLPRVLSGGRSHPYTSDPVAAARAFLQDNASLFALESGIGSGNTPTTFEPIRSQDLPHATKITFRQLAAGLPVIDAQVGVLVSPDGEIVHVASSAHRIREFDRNAALSVADAIDRAAGDLQVIRRGDLRTDSPPLLVVFPSDPPRPAYEIFMTKEGGVSEPWRIIVAADDGTILDRRRLVSESGARVFDPNPVARINNEAFSDQNDSDAAIPWQVYDSVSLENLDPPINDIYSLKGAYVWLRDEQIPTNIPPTSTDGNFVFYRADDGFEEVMAYFTIDRNQQHIQALGFTDINNRPVGVDAHGMFGFDNSRYYATPPGEGYIVFGDGGVDDAEDADVILHEYGHAIQDNSAPGVYSGTADNGYGNETGAMSEGFGDYWAASAGYDASAASGFPPAYLGEWDAKGYASGPEPYFRRVDNTKIYPADMTGEIHADGEIWSSTLWEIFNAAGRTATDAIVLYSHFLVPTNPDFEDGANALMDADALLYPVDLGPGVPVEGEHYNIICSALSSRSITTCSPICACASHGDAFPDEEINVIDIGATIDEVFFGTWSSQTDPLCDHLSRADYNCDQFLNVIDIGYVVDYVLKGGAGPCDPCAP